MWSPFRLARLLTALVLAFTTCLLMPVYAAHAVDTGSTIGERLRGLQAAQVALAQLGTPYAWGGGSLTGPTLGFCDGVNGYLPDGSCSADHTIGFDCSGLVRYAWFQASAGFVTLPHFSGGQSLQGRPIKRREDLLPGDLLFFAEPGGPIHHVGLYLGNGAMVHSEHTGTLVTVLRDVFHDPKWGSRLVAATRPEPVPAATFAPTLAPPTGVAPGE
ncbi:C40 family peptidase [Streptacidiphilus anmyonensis]|uniref:C40 family peptidase n=1 Tax=Streptacidiphilus anmyonensis TaxID=405782 RepID=UPI00069348B8|nr:C40 family peptidase [Streptacidiphilus anmyonensis]